jgi:DNA-3-methyladenine glycosylase
MVPRRNKFKNLETISSDDSSSNDENILNANKKLKLDDDTSIVGVPFKLERLSDSFYNYDCIDLCKKLLGKYLVRKTTQNELMVGKIVEVEAYLGGTSDRASHSFNNKKTDRNMAMYMKPGTAYVYIIYGMYCCLNISSRGDGSGVLIRALEPVLGIDLMKSNRLSLNNEKKNSSSSMNVKNLTNGPSKLCMAMNITKDLFNQVDLSKSDGLLWVQENFEDFQTQKSDDKIEIVKSKRIGLNSIMVGQDACDFLYRFYIKNNQFVSVKCKNDELESNE